MAMRMLGTKKKGEATGATNSTGTGAGVHTGAMGAIQALCDLHAQSDLDGAWRSLAKVYEQRRNDDNAREILALSAPTTRVDGLNGWHLERMAVGELGGDALGRSAGEVALIQQECRRSRAALRKILAHGAACQAQRDRVNEAMARQREVLLSELENAKEFLAQIHSEARMEADQPGFAITAQSTGAVSESTQQQEDPAMIHDELAVAQLASA